MNELENLNTIETNSRRDGGQNFDIKHDVEEQKFTVSDAFYAKDDMNNNGFTAHFGNGNAYLSVQSNDESVCYKGREGHEKGKQFKSTTTSELFEKLDLVGALRLEHVGEKNGSDFYRVEQITEDDTIDEEFPDTQEETVDQAETETEEELV